MLRGRPIGLKANMTKEEMKNHLIKKLEEWQKEGYTKEEVKQAIYSKCKPLGLTSNFYWAKYPGSAERLRQAWRELNWNIAETYQDSFNKLGNILKTLTNKNKGKEEKKEKINTNNNNFLNQFEEILK